MNRRNVLITGCNQGIGKEIFNFYKKKNYNVIGLGKRKKSLLSKNYYSIDLSNEKKVNQFCKKLNKMNIDILINNAGINKIGNFHLIKKKDLKEIFQINFFAPYQICQSVIPSMMKKKWGRIVNITSIFGSVTKELRSPYASSKFALNGLTKTLSAEYSKFNILSNAVAPGVIKTQLTKKILKNNIQNLVNKIPMGRLGTTNEIAEIVYWLGSEDNTFVTGQQVCVDGGYTIV